MMTCAPLAKSPNCASHSSERLRIVAAEAIFKAQHGGFRQNRSCKSQTTPGRARDGDSGTYSFSFSVSIQHRVAMVERSASRILSARAAPERLPPATIRTPAPPPCRSPPAACPCPSSRAAPAASGPWDEWKAVGYVVSSSVISASFSALTAGLDFILRVVAVRL